MIGLIVLLAQSAIPVPARSAELPLFSSVYADIGDEGSIEQSLSTFSAHVRNIRGILREADEKSLVLLDELGAGTDPIEGGPLGVAILEELLSRNVSTVVTTHFGFIKLHAVEHEQVEVASMEFDPETCRPTFRLVMGIPGRSNALEISRLLGLDESILARTERLIGSEDRSIDAIFKKLALLERELSSREERVSREESDLETLLALYRNRLREVREKESFLKGGFRRETARLLAEYRRNLEGSIRAIREEQASRRSVEEARQEAARVEESARDALGGDEPAEEEGALRGEGPPEGGGGPPEVGDLVEIRSGEDAAIRGKIVEFREGRVMVQAGSFRMQAGVDEVRVLERHGGRETPEVSWDYTASSEKKRLELDIRGMRLDDALREVTEFLDRAVLHNLDTVYIIHGLGTGALREGVWHILKDFPHADGFEYAHPDQGGYGCTVVTLKSSS
jgi:DNA mismatch repair protein MutS2